VLVQAGDGVHGGAGGGSLWACGVQWTDGPFPESSVDLWAPRSILAPPSSPPPPSSRLTQAVTGATASSHLGTLHLTRFPGHACPLCHSGRLWGVLSDSECWSPKEPKEEVYEGRAQVELLMGCGGPAVARRKRALKCAEDRATQQHTAQRR
jgi:hypothetical protein